MTTPHRRRWMSEYMSNFRRNSGKREELRKDHRMDSFIWRLSKFLGPQYDILMCMQYGPFAAYDNKDISIEDRDSNDRYEDKGNDETRPHIFVESFPTFLYFYIWLEPGEEIFLKLLVIGSLICTTPLLKLFGVWLVL